MKSLNEFSFEWLAVLKHKYDKKVVLKNKDIVNESSKNLKFFYQQNHIKTDSFVLIKGISKTVVMQNQYENFNVSQMNCNIAYDFEYLGKKSKS